MSPRSQPPSPLYPSQAQSAPSASTAPAAPTSMAATQTTPAPFALPAPPFYAPQHRAVSLLPPPLQLGPVPPPSGALPRHPSSVAFTAQDRWAGAPGNQPGAGQGYTPPISDPSYSPSYGHTLHGQTEFGGRPPLPAWEQRTWPPDPRSEFSAYPSPAYGDPRGGESAFGPAPPTQVGLEAQPRRRTSLLAGEPATTSGQDQYELRVRQQPIAARACGFGERDRRVIDPPPIVQLTFRGPSPTGAEPAELQYPFNVVHCTLWNEEGTADETAISGQDRRVTRRLMGTLVASPFVGTDENDQRGCFFSFPDLSCRTHGRYRLRFVLMRIEMGHVRPGGYMPILTSTTSDVFTVYTAKNFPGMRASTALTKALKRQGCAISVKKGNEKANIHAREEESEEEDMSESRTTEKAKKRRKG